MKLQQIYDLGVQMAIDADPRGKETVGKLLTKRKKTFEELEKSSSSKKKYFDKENLVHPYSDSRIYVGNVDKEIKKVIVGIDAGVGEVVLVDRLNEKGFGIDAIITHHPHGEGLAGLSEVMEMLIEMQHNLGVPVNVADAINKERTQAVGNRFRTIPNHNQTIDAARLLNVPLVSMHTVWDNLTWKYLTDYISKKEHDNLGELLEYLDEVPEFEESAKYKAGPIIVAGGRESRTGKIMVDCTGGTNTGKEIYDELGKVGIGTVVQMHIAEDEIKELKKNKMNAIDTGHIPSDSIGANIFLDQLGKNGVEVITFGGLVRVKRSNK